MDVSFEPLLTKMKIRDKLMLKNIAKREHQGRIIIPSWNQGSHQDDAALIPFLWLWLCLFTYCSQKQG
jgi:hypothetical protein